MPTILIQDGFRLFFYSNEGVEPPHVHVEYQGAVAKFWVQPVRAASNLGMTKKDFAKAYFLVTRHQTKVLEKWYEFFGQ